MISLDQLRNSALTGALSISQQGAQQPAEIKNTGFLHKIGTWLGISSSVRQNENTINAIRTAIRSDPKLFLVQKKADELLGAVKGTITAEKMREIIADLDTAAGKMSDIKRRTTMRDIVQGQLAAAGTPKFAKALGADFKKFYTKIVANTAIRDAGDEPEGGWISFKLSQCRQAKKTLGDCFKIIGDDPEKRAAFAKMCTAPSARILTGRADGLLPADECLAIARGARALFDKADELGAKYGTAMKQSLMATLSGMPSLISPEKLEELVSAGRRLGANTSLASLNKRHSADQIRAELDKFTREVGALNITQGVKGGSDAKVTLVDIVVSSAILAMDQDDQEDLFAVLTSDRGREASQGRNIAVFMQKPLELATARDFENPDAYKEMSDDSFLGQYILTNFTDVETTSMYEERMANGPLFDDI